MIKYEHRTHYDAYGTGNYTMDKENCFSEEITEERARQYVEFLTVIGCKHYETSEAHFYEKDADSTHYTQYIFYK